MKNKIILVTGGAGFIGSNFIEYFLEKYPDHKVINLDALTYAGNLTNLNAVSENSRYQFIHGSITDRKLVQTIFENYDIQGVIHFAAESHVDNSIENPAIFLETNVLGTQVLLDAAYKNWMQVPFVVKENFKTARFHHISTDEVYGSLGSTGYFTETTAYAPNSPYSASKAASDLLARAYFHTYGLNVVTTNCSNNYGPRQHAEKLIPTIIRQALAEAEIPIYGDGKNIRDWLYVLDHCCAIDLVFHQAKAGALYNVGGNHELTNNQIARKICDLLDEIKPRANGKKYAELIHYVKDRPGHDRRYAIDAKKIREELGWVASENLIKNLTITINAYINSSK